MYEQWANKNYYEMLGLNKDASKSEIKDAYKSIALAYHPDSNFFDEIIDDKLNSDQSKIFQILTVAYSTLMDDTKRNKYNEVIFFNVENWEINEDDDDEDGIQETKIFSFDDLEFKYRGTNFGVFGTVQKITDPQEMQILSTYQIMNKQTNVISKLMRFMGLYS